MAAGDSMPMPHLPAVRGPDGDTDAATAISRCGRVYGASWSFASRSSNHDVFLVTISPRMRRMITSSDSVIMSRWLRGSMPSIIASDGSRPGPDAEHGAAARQVVELHHAVGDHERMMVGQRDDAGAEPDALRARRDVGDEELRATR